MMRRLRYGLLGVNIIVSLILILIRLIESGRFMTDIIVAVIVVFMFCFWSSIHIMHSSSIGHGGGVWEYGVVLVLMIRIIIILRSSIHGIIGHKLVAIHELRVYCRCSCHGGLLLSIGEHWWLSVLHLLLNW